MSIKLFRIGQSVDTEYGDGKVSGLDTHYVTVNLNKNSVKTYKYEDVIFDENDLICPFCEEEGFDKHGLKNHLVNYCDAYSDTSSE